MDKSPREPFRDIGHHQEGLGCQPFLLWPTALCVWLWGLIFSFQVFVLTFFFLFFASTLNHSGSYLWGWNNITSDLLTVLQFPGSQNMGDRTDLTVFFATQTIPRGGKGRNPLRYIIIRTKYFIFRGSFCRVLIHRSKADGNFFPGSICLTCFSPSFVQHPVLLYCIYTPKTHRKVLAMECTPTFVEKMCWIWALWNCLRATSVWIFRGSTVCSS